LPSEAHPALLRRPTGPVTSGQVTVIIYGHFASKEDLRLSAMKAAAKSERLHNRYLERTPATLTRPPSPGPPVGRVGKVFRPSV
jgi:hypothetical protein